MAPGDGSFRNRAASLIPQAQHSIRRSLHRHSNAEKFILSPKILQTERASGDSINLEKSQSHISSGGTHHTSGSDAADHDRDAQRTVRTIPTWVLQRDEDDEELLPPNKSYIPALPLPPHVAQHNSTPALFGQSHPPRGRLHDHEREWIPPLPRGSVRDTGSRWRAFATSSSYPSISADPKGETVSEDWLIQNGPDYSRPWLADAMDGDPEKGNASMRKSYLKRKAWYEKFARTILRSPVVPLVLRMIVFGFSMIALALACSIHHDIVDSTTSTIMAIVVDAVAMVYLVGVTYDEYSGKPLGLRPPSAKMRLIFLDLFFIVFDSSNLSLAFEALQDSPNRGVQTSKQRALASVLLIALIAWLMTFSISVMRVVERVQN